MKSPSNQCKVKPREEDLVMSPTVLEIMNDSVNDNTPGFLFWAIRIGLTSLLCALLFGAYRYFY